MYKHWYLVKLKLGFGESFLVTLFGVDAQSTGWWGRLAMFFFHLTAMMLGFGNETSFVLVDNDLLCNISLTDRKSLQAQHKINTNDVRSHKIKT